MSDLKRILKSIGAAVLAMAAGSAVIGGFLYVAAKLSEKAFLILMLSIVALAVLTVLASMFYVNFGIKPPAPPTT